MNGKSFLTILALGLFCTACQLFVTPPTPIPSETPQPTPDVVTPSPIPTETLPLIDPVTPTLTNTPKVTPTGTPTQTPDPVDYLTDEAIMIIEPAPGSRVTSPVRVRGYADPTFEQNLLMRIILDDGTMLPVDSTIIQGEEGQRGYFEFEYHFVRGGQGFIQVYDISARDGGIIHLSTVGVLLDPVGTPEISIREPYLQQIAILSPEHSQVISGGVITVEAIGIASFEQTLIIDILDEFGAVVGSDFVTLTTGLGEYGVFQVTVTYSITSAQPGRVIVRDPSPAFPGDFHLTSKEIMLKP